MTHSIVSLEMIRNSLIFKFKSESELLRQIEKLSVNFTQQRENIGDYLKDEKMVAAYSCFYLLTNIPKLKSCLNLLNLNLVEYKDYEILDIGAGPATFSMALLEMDSGLKIRAIEKSQLMMKQGLEFVRNFFPTADFEYLSLNHIPPKKEQKRLGIFGHSANEMGANIALDYITKWELDDVIFIEPGTKVFYHEFLKIREALLTNFNILYPCLSGAKCPLTVDDWCHQYLTVSHSVEVERLTQLAQKDRRNLPISLSHFRSINHKIWKDRASSIDARIIRVFTATKFSVEWQVCYAHTYNEAVNAFNIEKDVQILLRGLSKKEIKDLKNKRAGDIIKFNIEKILSENKVRGKLL